MRGVMTPTASKMRALNPNQLTGLTTVSSGGEGEVFQGCHAVVVSKTLA